MLWSASLGTPLGRSAPLLSRPEPSFHAPGSLFSLLCLWVQLHPTLCGLMGCSPLGSSVHAFSKEEYWSGLPFLTLGDLPDSGIEPVSLSSPALAGEFFTTFTTWVTFLKEARPNHLYLLEHPLHSPVFFPNST